MEGLGVAASGIAVVSLAVQLVGSIRDIRRFLGQVSGAPRELKRLINLLEQLELILQNIGMVVENQRKHNGTGDVDVSSSVLRAIEACESRVATVQEVVDSAKRSSISSNRTTRALGSFKLACKKREIEDFESQLLNAISLLNLVMTTNLTNIYSQSMAQLLSEAINTNRISTTIINKLFILRGGTEHNSRGTSGATHSTTREGRGSLERSRLAKLSKRPYNQLTTISSYTGLFGRLLVRSTTQSSNFDDKGELLLGAPYIKKESTWVLVPSFLSTCINYQWVNACGFIQRSIRIYPFLSNDHPIWDLCINGNLEGIQAVLSKGQISPFSVNKWGDTLLHEATVHSKVETCRFLFNLGLNGAKANNYGRRPHMQLLFGPHDFNDFRDTKVLFTSRCDEIDITEHCHHLFSQQYFQPTIQMFNDLVNEFVSEETVNKFHETPIPMAMRMLWSSEPALHDEWKKTIRHVIDLGANLSKGHTTGTVGTLLDNIMNLVARPFDSIWLGKEWLDVLSKSKVDTVEYLQREFRVHFDEFKSLPMLSPDVRSDNRPRYLIISEDIPSVSWDWFIDPQGPVFDLLLEFRNFGPTISDVSYIGCVNLTSNYVEEEETEMLEEEDETWPFFYPDWQERLRRGWRDPETLKLRKIAKARYENRRRKKARKLGKAREIRRVPKMPGSWIN